MLFRSEKINVSPNANRSDSPRPPSNQQPIFKPPVSVPQTQTNEIKPTEPTRQLTPQEIRMKNNGKSSKILIIILL